MDNQTKEFLMEAAIQGCDPDTDEKLKRLIQQSPENACYWEETIALFAALNPSSSTSHPPQLPSNFHDSIFRKICVDREIRSTNIDNDGSLQERLTTVMRSIFRVPRAAVAMAAVLFVILAVERFSLTRNRIPSEQVSVGFPEKLQLSMGKSALESEDNFRQMLKVAPPSDSKRSNGPILRMMDRQLLGDLGI